MDLSTTAYRVPGSADVRNLRRWMGGAHARAQRGDRRLIPLRALPLGRLIERQKATPVLCDRTQGDIIEANSRDEKKAAR